MIPRTYQKEALEACLEELKKSARVGVVLPTGGGKSLVETMLIDRWADEMSFNQVILVVCHLTDVVDQLNLAYAEHGRYGKRAMRFTTRTKPRLTTKVLFATVQTLTASSARKYWTSDPMRKEVSLIIIDEAHQFGNDGYDILSHDLFPLARVVGFSATPYRKNQFSFSQFDAVAYAIDSQTLIAQGFLVPPKLFAMNMESMSAGERFAAIVQIWQDSEKARKLVSVVYLRTTFEAQEMRLVAEEAGIKVEFVSGQSSQTFCRDLFTRARKGEVEMIVNVHKLETGIDIPNIGAIFMPYGTNSVTTYLQRIGRALRPWAGKSAAHVYVFGDAPSIAKGLWNRIQRDALSAKNPLDPLVKLEDDLADLIEDAAPAGRISWTKEAIKACQLLMDGNMPAVATLIAEKRFPEKYAKAIGKLTQMMKTPKADPERKPISEAQIALLSEKHRFKPEHIAKLSESEAGAILSALSGYFSRGPFILQSGPHAGKHIADTPSMYRRFLKDPANRAVWQHWIRAGRPESGDNDGT